MEEITMIGTTRLEFHIDVQSGANDIGISATELARKLRETADELDAAAKLGFELSHAKNIGIHLKKYVTVDLSKKTPRNID